MFAAVRGTQIYFDVEGMGLVPAGPVMRERPAAMVIHGGPGSDHSGFKPSFSPLTAAMQLIYFDHRGQGRSAAADPVTYTLDENVADMEALRRHLGLGPIISIGTSYGGMVAMAHAARHPDAVSHLALIVTTAHGGFIPRAQAIMRERGTPEQQAACETLWAGAFRSAEEMRQVLRRDGADVCAALRWRCDPWQGTDDLLAGAAQSSIRAGWVPAAVRSAGRTAPDTRANVGPGGAARLDLSG